MNQDVIFLVLIALAIAVSAWGVMQIVLGLTQSDKKRIRERLMVDWKKELASDLGRVGIKKQEETLPDLLAGFNLARKLHNSLKLVYPNTTLPQFLWIVAALAIGGFVVVGLATQMLSAAALAGFIGAVLPFLVLNQRRNKRQRLLNDQLCDALDFLARVLRAGHSLATGFQMMGDELPDPIASEFRQCYDQHNLGQPLEQVMLDMARRVGSSDFAFFVTSVLIQRQTGGDLAELLDNIGNVVRARIRLGQHVKALTAEGRLTGFILTLLPPAMFVVLYFLNPQYAGLLINTPPGRIALAVMITLMIIGKVLIKKIITVRA